MPLAARLFAPRPIVAVTGAASLGLVVGGVILAQTMNLAACPLCVLQRMVYLLLSLEALVTVLVARSEIAARGGALLMAVTATLGAGIAGYQTWLQRFAKGVGCTADQPWWEHFVNWAGSQWPLLFEASGLCSEAGWRLLSLSIAEWSLIAFSTMFAALLAASLRGRPGVKPIA